MVVKKKKQNRFFFKDRIPNKCNFAVWIEPDAGSENQFSAFVKMVDDNSVVIVDEVDITASTSKATAFKQQLFTPEIYAGTVKVLFKGEGFGATIHTEVIKPDDTVFGKCPSLKVPNDDEKTGRRPFLLRTIQGG